MADFPYIPDLLRTWCESASTLPSVNWDGSQTRTQVQWKVVLYVHPPPKTLTSKKTGIRIRTDWLPVEGSFFPVGKMRKAGVHRPAIS